MPVDATVTLRHAHDTTHGRVDPHYWLSASNANAIARTVAAELARLAPDGRAEIDRRSIQTARTRPGSTFLGS